MLDISDFNPSKKPRQHIFAVFLLFAVSLIFFHSIISNSTLLDNVHHINNLAFLSYSIKDGIFNHHEFPLWTPYFFSGIPLIAIPEHYIFDMNLVLILLFRDIYLAMNMSVIIYFFAAGLGMYFLVFEMIGSKKSAFISALIYMLNGFMHTFLIGAHINLLESYALIPFAVLFTIKALKEKEWIAYSILAGAFLAMQILMGGVIFFFYTAVLLGLLIVYNFVLNPNLKNIKRITSAVAIIAFVMLGLSVVKLLPTIEFVRQSSRASAVSYGEYLGNPLNIKNAFNIFIYNIGYNDISGALGIVGFALLLLGLMSFRKKYLIFSIIIVVLGILLAAGTPIAKLFFNYVPGFSQMRHIERALVFFVLGSSVAIGYGSLNLFSKLQNKKISKFIINAVFILLVVAIFSEMFLFQNKFAVVKVVNPDDIGLLQHISKDKDLFRTMNLGLKEIVGTSGYVYYAQKGIEDAKGGGGIWTDDYINYIAISEQLNPSRLWGLINVKYVVSDNPVDIPNIEFIGKFNECKDCGIWQAFGPYLYLNKDYVEKAYSTDKAVLVVGDGKSAKDTIYFLISRNPNPSNSVIIQGGVSINDYSSQDLRKFSAIILGKGSADQNSLALLRNYQASGGTILPDVLNDKSVIDQNDINDLFHKINGTHEHIDIKSFSYNDAALDISGKKGFVVFGERYAFFPGWKVMLDGKNAEIMKANNYITSIYIDGNYNEMKFQYKPASFYNGLYITLAALFLIIIYFSFLAYKRINAKKAL